MLEFDDTVDAEFSVFMRNVHIINMRDEQRDVRLFFIKHSSSVMLAAIRTRQYICLMQMPSSTIAVSRRDRRQAFKQDDDGNIFDQYSVVGPFGIADVKERFVMPKTANSV